jgi:hypothetical protein
MTELLFYVLCTTQSHFFKQKRPLNLYNLSEIEFGAEISLLDAQFR